MLPDQIIGVQYPLYSAGAQHVSCVEAYLLHHGFDCNRGKLSVGFVPHTNEQLCDMKMLDVKMVCNCYLTTAKYTVRTEGQANTLRQFQSV